MQTTLQGIVTGISKYEIDGGLKGASLFMVQATSGRNPNIIGQEMLKLALPFHMFEELRHHEQAFNEFQQFQVDGDIEAGSQGKPKITVLAIRPIQVTNPVSEIVETPVSKTVENSASKAVQSKKL